MLPSAAMDNVSHLLCNSIFYRHALDICTADKHNNRRSPFQLIHILWGCQLLSLPPLIYSPSSHPKSWRASEIKARCCHPLKRERVEDKSTAKERLNTVWFTLSILSHPLFLSFSHSICLRYSPVRSKWAGWELKSSSMTFNFFITDRPKNIPGETVFLSCCL